MFNKVWLLSTGERAVKTFVQAYITMWVLAAGIVVGGTVTEVPNVEAFDLLFTTDNLKGAVVATVLSLGSSLLSTPLGPDNSPSLTVTETTPTSPPTPPE